MPIVNLSRIVDLARVTVYNNPSETTATIGSPGRVKPISDIIPRGGPLAIRTALLTTLYDTKQTSVKALHKARCKKATQQTHRAPKFLPTVVVLLHNNQFFHITNTAEHPNSSFTWKPAFAKGRTKLIWKLDYYKAQHGYYIPQT